MARTVKLIHSGMAKMLREQWVESVVRGPAERVAAAAKATAPVETGAYRDSIHVEMVMTDRVVARVVASDRKAPIIEARTGNLARAIGSAKG